MAAAIWGNIWESIGGGSK